METASGFRHPLQTGTVICLLGIVFAAGSLTAFAAEPLERRLLPDDAVVTIEAQNISQWARHPLLTQLWETLSQTAAAKAGLETPEYERLRLAQSYLESLTGEDWLTSLQQLTAGGVWMAFTPKPAERQVIILTAANNKLWKRLYNQLLKDEKENGKEPPEILTHRGIKTYHIQDLYVCVLGPRLVATSQEKDLKRIIDELLKQSDPPSPVQSTSKNPSITIELNLKMVRLAPEMKKALTRPASDAGMIAILGGWVDLLGAADRLELKLDQPKNSSDIQLHLLADNAKPNKVQSGFFASSENDRLAPLLNPPGTIYTASWFRDYGALWKQRRNLLTESSREKLEKGDQEIKQQFSVFGVTFTPSDFFQQLGTKFRVVAVRSGKSAYRVELKNQLPAAAVCISLRDEKEFLTHADPLFRAIGLVAAFGEAKMMTRSSQHANAKLKGLWFRDDETAVKQGDRLRYNFNPTWTVTRNHLVVGSTTEVVTQVIDELDRQLEDSQITGQGSMNMTDRQRLSFTELAGGLEDFRKAIVQNTVLERGFTFSQAVTELTQALKAVNTLGQLTTESGFTPHGFEYRVRIQPRIQTSSKK